MGPARNYINFTDGGLAVNERLQVLDRPRQAIPGLYAAGAVGHGGAACLSTVMPTRS
ncbi:MAG: FAD-binding protein [Betaproteobacteria bacterium]|nr:FAD-binding protein [Betaproteobacteria bacterium]